MSVYRFVSAQVPLKTRATQLSSHTLTDYLQMYHHRFERILPLQPRLGPFLELISLVESQTGHRTP